jgi:dissimilatory sulfite reductase (desulfoviridin) alpha/beta subunit
MFGVWQGMNNPRRLTNGWRINKMEHKYKGWIVEKMGSDHFNMRLETESNWHDAANTFREAKQIIDRTQSDDLISKVK